MKAVVAAFNQEKALVGAFSVITNLRMELFEALAPHTHTHADCRAFVIILLIDTNFQNKESRDAGVTYLRVICHWMKNAGARELRPLALIIRDMCKSNSWMKAEQASRRWILKIPTLLLCTDWASNESSRSVKFYNDEEGGLPGWKWLLALSHLGNY